MPISQSRIKKMFAWIAGATLVIAVTAGSLEHLTFRHAVGAAEAQLKNGYATLAVDTLEPYRQQLVSDPEDCDLLLRAYLAADRAERTEWAAEACLSAGFESPRAYFGLADIHERRSEDMEALKILAKGAEKFDRSPEISYRLARVFRKLNAEHNAVDAYLKTASLAPTDEKVLLEALQYFLGVQEWSPAHDMATLLRESKTDDPEVKLLIARGYEHGDDWELARPIVAQAQDLLAKVDPERASALRKEFGDLLSGKTFKELERRSPASHGSGLAALVHAKTVPHPELDHLGQTRKRKHE